MPLARSLPAPTVGLYFREGKAGIIYAVGALGTGKQNPEPSVVQSHMTVTWRASGHSFRVPIVAVLYS